MTSPGLIDSHCHLDIVEPDSGKIPILLQECRDRGIDHLIHISTSRERFLAVVPLVQEWPKLLSITLGLMPGKDIKLIDHKFIRIIEEKQICAIGEIGLDYYRGANTQREQIALLECQCSLAMEYDLPVVLHNRDADADLLAVLSSFSGLQGVFHCFTGDRKMAEKVLEAGFHISFSGIVTFRNAEAIQDAAGIVPADRILVETDAPYLAPVPVRGTPNRPWFISYTAHYLATLRREDPEEFIGQTAKNTRRLFRLREAG